MIHSIKYLLTALGLLASFLLELFQLLFVLSLYFKFHLGQLNLVLVLSASDLVLQVGALVAPFIKFEIIHDRFLLDVFICIDVLCDFCDCNVTSFLLFGVRCSELVDGAFCLFHLIIDDLVVLLLEVEQLVS